NSIVQFLIVSSPATYAEWTEKEFEKIAEEAYREMQNSSALAEKLSKTYELELTPLAKAGQEVCDSFFNQPLVPAMLSSSISRAQNKPTKSSSSQAPQEKQGEIPLGLNRENSLVSEPINFFAKTIVSAGIPENRTHIIQVMAENAMLSNIAITVIDENDSFGALSGPAKNSTELMAAGINIEPIGFPTKKFEIKKELSIDLNLVNIKGLMQLLGIGNEKIIKFIEEKQKEKKHENLDGFVEFIKQSKTNADINQYQINKIARIFLLVKSIYGDVFGANNPVEEISRVWVKSLGRTGIVSLKEIADGKIKLMLLHSVVKGIVEHYKAEGSSKSLKALIVLPKSSEFVGKDKDLILQNEIKDLFMEGIQYGVGHLLESEHANDLKDELVAQFTAKLSIVSGLDTGVDLEGRTPYRVTIRPTLSKTIGK
ncbi:MAG: hypothetical protein Q7K42_05445, partial [Candidatus Diapherotrites archaeon]|nr:hypothetical protein [Candidatus Diapherotrites archaeon]